MKIYGDVLTRSDLLAARINLGLYLDEIEAIRNPRVRACGWGVRTSGNTNRWRNSGTHGADHGDKAASWDQHGQWFARLFAIDPKARIAIYDGAEDFHARTKDKYKTQAVFA